MTAEELIEHSHAQAVKSGWWPNGAQGRTAVEQTNNFLSEIMEAWEEYRAGRMGLWWSGHDDIMNLGHDGLMYHIDGTPFKPEGFWVEIADLLVRLGDTMGAYKWKYQDVSSQVMDMSKCDIPRFIFGLSATVSRMLDLSDNDFPWRGDALDNANGLFAVCIAMAKANGVDLLATCDLKMSYNTTRPKRHGGKLA
jgi:hypothetical protein